MNMPICKEINAFLVACGATIHQWIPADQPPKFYPGKRKTVLITVEDNDGKRFVTSARWDEQHQQWYGFKSARYLDFKVVAWMEKPRAYEGK